MSSFDSRSTRKLGKSVGGLKFSMIENTTKNNFEVWVERENYNPNVKGGLSKSWRYVKMGLTKQEALDLYEKKLKSKAK